MTVHDCILFFNELDALELRLDELEHVVDRVVLVEARSTFSGRPKPLLFEEQRQRYARHLHRIEHVVLDELPGRDAWAREAFQRDAILRGLGAAHPEDVVLISDVDEIPRPEVITRFAEGGGEAAALVLRFYYYKLNCQNVRGTPAAPWSVILRRRLLGSPQRARERKHQLPHLLDAGWHFSCLGDERAIKAKIEAYSHQELNVPRFTGLDEIRRRASAGQDLFDRPGFEWRFVPIDESFPRVVRERRERFTHLIAPVDSEPAVVSALEAGTADPTPVQPPATRRPRILLLFHRDPTTTAAYLEPALRRRADVVTAGEGQEVELGREPVFLPHLLDSLGQSFDAVLEVQGDSVDVTGQELVDVPCAWWAIDSHLCTSYGYHFFRAKAFDHVFVAQKHHVYRYRDWSWTSASWLPLAADPAVFRPFPARPAFEVGFVGSLRAGLHEARRRLLARIYDRYQRVGFGRGLWREEAAAFAAGCRLTFNRSLNEDVNMRVFELVACGRPLLTDRLPAKCGQDELFDPERHLLLYEDDTLEDTIERWLAEPGRAEERAAAARAHLLSHHTYDHRAQELLRVLGLS